MPKFNKTKGFSLKSGNKPTFQQMGSGSPLDKTLIGNQINLPDHLRAKIEDAPGKMYDTPGKMDNAPLKAEDGTEKTTEEVTEETEEQKKARLEEEKKEPVKPRDSNAAMAGKFALNMLMGGMTESGMIKDKHSLAINYGPKKGEEAAEALTPGQKELQNPSFVSTYNPKKEDGTYKTVEEYDAEFAAFKAKKK